MASLIKLRTAPSQRSPAREALAVAITKRSEALAYLDLLKASLDFDGAACRAVRTARMALHDAGEALVSARADTVTRMGGVVQPSAAPVISIREARANIAAAEELLDVARIARSGVEGGVEAAEKSHGYCEWTLRDRALDVLKDEVGPLQAGHFANVLRLKRELEAASQAVNWLLHKGIFTGIGLETQYTLRGGNGEAIWEGALAALMADADAELPQ
jgi:hypothetical protein